MLQALQGIPVIDQHCHNLAKEYVPLRSVLSESSDTSHVPSSLAFQRSVRDLAQIFGCIPTEVAVEKYRQQLEDQRC